MADAEAVLRGVRREKEDADFQVLVPNLRGLERAIAAGPRRVQVGLS